MSSDTVHHEFLSVPQVVTSMIFKLYHFIFFTLPNILYACEIVGTHNIPEEGKGALFIGLHSTHNSDIFFGQMALYNDTHRLLRGLLHRFIYTCNPWIKWVGLVSGRRGIAVSMLKAGEIVGVLPGGAEEAMTGHDKAYKLHHRWDDREGFAQVAIDANVPVIPIFMRNAEEMKWNPFFYMANRVGLSQAWSAVSNGKHPINRMLKAIGMFVWYTLSWISIPVPVKLTLFIGEPLHHLRGESARNFADRCKKQFQKMIDEIQPHGHTYAIGIAERLGHALSKNKLI